MKYSIGNHIVEIEGAELVDAVAALNSFKPFITDDGGKAVVQFSYEGNLSNAEFALVANGKFLYSSENDGVLSELYELGGDRYLQRMRRSGKEFRGTGTGCCYDDELYQVVDRSGGRAAIYGTLDLQMLRFALWIGYGILTSNLKTIAIHSSCIVYRGKAVIFLGESGTGKSTHTRLWRENIMGASLLNDDSPIIRIGEGVEVYGSPWSGKTPCYRQEVYPLAAIVRLYQAPFNKIEKLPVLGAYGALHPSCPPDFAYSADLYDGISSTIGKILERVPVYMMGCLPDADAARTSCEKIFG